MKSASRYDIEEVLALLKENPAQIAAVMGDLTPAQLRNSPGPEEWSANELLAHLRCCSDVRGKFILAMIDEDVPTLRDTSPRGWIKRTNYLELTFAESWSAFVAQRNDLLARLEPLSVKDWARTAILKASRPMPTPTVLLYAQKLATHEHHHLDQFVRIAAAVRTWSPRPT
jgi:hypothetical protein